MADLTPVASGVPPIVIHNHPVQTSGFARWLFRTFLTLSIIVNVALLSQVKSYTSATNVVEKFKDGDASAPDKIALIAVNGVISTETIQSPKKELKHAAEDHSVKAVVLVVDSPGGTISGSDELFHAIEDFRAKTERRKPLVVSMQGIAASGGYYISMPADKIFAERSCITGSIGVIASMFQVEKLMDKLGVKSEVIKSGAMKDSGSPFRAMNDEDRKEWQKLIGGMYEQFLGVVLKYRKSAIGGEAALRKLADGRVFLAEEALQYKLIDAIGYQEDAIAEAKKLAQLPERVRIIGYSRPLDSLWGMFLGESAAPPMQFDARKLWELQSPQLLYMAGPMINLTR